MRPAPTPSPTLPSTSSITSPMAPPLAPTALARPWPRRRGRLWTRLWSSAWAGTASCCALLALLVWWWGSDGAYPWHWRRALRYVGEFQEGAFVAGPLLLGLGLTVRIVAASMVLAVALGLGAALLRRGPSRVGQGLAAGYVGLVRNTPLLIQLFAVYFVVGPIFGLSPFWAAVWALAAFEGAYMAEIFRAGIADVPAAQWDAARSLGMPAHTAFASVILPQAVRRVLPPLTSQAVSLIKDSALVSAIALPDLTMRAQAVIADTFLSLELWTLVAALYLLLTLMVSVPARWMERAYRWRWL